MKSENYLQRIEPQGCKDTYLLGQRPEGICNYSSCLHGGRGDRDGEQGTGCIQSASESGMRAGMHTALWRIKEV